jgi:Carbohydrate family 9 binding domain-like
VVAGSFFRQRNIAIVAATVVATALHAQTARTTEFILSPPTEGIVAARVRAQFRIDGALDEPVWRAVKPTTHFVQREPNEGAPALLPSEVRMILTDSAVIIGARMDDDYRARLSAFGPPTDGAAGGYLDDYFEVQIDPHAQHLTAFALSVTPNGTKRSWIVGQDGSRDASWNVAWEVATHVDAKGWTVEMRIPLSEFHITPGTEHWGVQFVRFSWRRQETDVFRAAATTTTILGDASPDR